MKEELQEVIDSLAVAEERQVFISTPGGDTKETQEYKAIWNLNTNTLGCIASKKYNIIQHRQVVNALFTALDNLNLKYEWEIKTDNHRLFLDVKFPETKMLIKVGEEFIGGIRLVNSYDKTTGLLILPRLERLACANGMIVTKFLFAYSIKHNQKLVHDFEGVIGKSLNQMINSSSVLKALINNCIDDSVEWKYAGIVLFNLLHRKKHVKEIMMNLTEKDEVTRWDIYNSITQYATHGAQIKPTVESWLQYKAQQLLETELKQLTKEIQA
jgi:hypothetical protein